MKTVRVGKDGDLLVCLFPLLLACFFSIIPEGYILEGKIYALIKHKRLNLKRQK